MKKINGLLIVVLLFLFCGCTQAIPEGPIKDFVDLFSFEEAYEETKTAEGTITQTYYEQEQAIGSVRTRFCLDQSTKEKYYYQSTDASGTFLGDGGDQYLYENQQILTYLESDGSVFAQQKCDDRVEMLSYNDEDVTTSIKNFFYLELEAGYHSGGLYYGDYILANAGRYYPCFSLSEDKQTLIYQVNTAANDEDGYEIVTMHYFEVNTNGMVLKLSSKSINWEKQTAMETIIECRYNGVISRLEQL